ncbi:hypothetical protein GE061_009818 [Apolygus lucorum]|uniref:MD-2-related lipid-recognition domain-containing protein n=1 Tax=Apolygus lucorum TaxID=248454 RepID=A0A8S9Y2V5_APOLU|nr:hypothetical protein GE061_009818 [Apolygus lucorum]
MSINISDTLCVILRLLLLFFYVGFVNSKTKVVRTVQIKEYVGCNMELPFHQEGITVNMTGKGLITMNGHLDIDETVGNLTQVSVNVEKCRSVADKSSCEFFAAASYDSPCQMVVARGMLWTPTFDRIQPRLTCPFKKGSYVLKESSLDASLLSKLIKPGDFWRATLKLFVGKRLVSCFKVGVELVEIRNRLSP